MNDNHYISKSSKSRLINEANQIYENFSSSRQQAAQQQQQQSTRFSTKATIETKPSTQWVKYFQKSFYSFLPYIYRFISWPAHIFLWCKKNHKFFYITDFSSVLMTAIVGRIRKFFFFIFFFVLKKWFHNDYNNESSL